MNLCRYILISALVLSLIGNGWLGYQVYKNSRILHMQADSYNTFKLSLSEAVKATDAETRDHPGSPALASDAVSANRSLQRAIGTIWGLRTDFAKKGMDIYPIYLVLMESENVSPYEPNFYSKETHAFIDKNSKRLHDLESTLGSTSFTNSGINQLRKAISSLYEKYEGHPSYSKLQ